MIKVVDSLEMDSLYCVCVCVFIYFLFGLKLMVFDNSYAPIRS